MGALGSLVLGLGSLILSPLASVGLSVGDSVVGGPLGSILDSLGSGGSGGNGGNDGIAGDIIGV